MKYTMSVTVLDKEVGPLKKLLEWVKEGGIATFSPWEEDETSLMQAFLLHLKEKVDTIDPEGSVNEQS